MHPTDQEDDCLMKLLSQTVPATFFLLLIASGCSKTDGLVVLRGPTMGTTYTIKIAHKLKLEETQLLHRQIEETLAQINKGMSTYEHDSELSFLNRQPADRWLEISTPLYEVLNIAHQVYLESAGAFDVTVGPLVNLWGFGPGLQTPKRPKKLEIHNVMNFVGFDLLELGTRPVIKKNHSGVFIDLSGIAKGYGVDRIAALLGGDGLENFMVEIGGEIRLSGRKFDGSHWNVAIEDPSDTDIASANIFHFADIAVASSGNYRNYREIDEVRYGHTINPRIGYPVTHNLTAVTVLHKKATWADAYATALMVLGPEEGLKFATDRAIAARFVSSTDGEATTFHSPAFLEEVNKFDNP